MSQKQSEIPLLAEPVGAEAMRGTLSPGVPSPTALRLLPWEDFDSSVSVDYHMHTTYTDGAASVRQMAEAAASKGINHILFSEHVRHTSTYYSSFASEAHALQCPGLKIHVGVETKIVDEAGHLDCSPQITSMCDAIVGSVHNPPAGGDGKSRDWPQLDAAAAVELEFRLAMAIVTRSRAHILGHPMGMVVTRFNLLPLEQLYQLARACREYDKALELNARYCPSPTDWIGIVRRANCKVSFGSDAHTTSQVGQAWRLFGKEVRGLP